MYMADVNVENVGTCCLFLMQMRRMVLLLILVLVLFTDGSANVGDAGFDADAGDTDCNCC